MSVTTVLRQGAIAARVASAVLAAVFASGAHAGPVDVYRTGPRYCPNDRPAGARALSQAEAIARARTLVPDDFCGPTAWVSGCDAIPEFALGSWRIFLHQYKLRGDVKDFGGLSHTYVILDRVGNCLANIPGTEIGAPR